MSAPPKRPYVELGIVESQQEPGSTDDSAELVAKMRAFAGKHGCDGLVNFTSNDSVTETMLAPGGATRVDTLSGYRASCIAYLKDTAPAPKAPSADLPIACAPNATQLCHGPGGCRGAQNCTPDGRAWSLCDCGSSPSQPQPTAAEQ